MGEGLSRAWASEDEEPILELAINPKIAKKTSGEEWIEDVEGEAGGLCMGPMSMLGVAARRGETAGWIGQ
jgi:hypothetical protein